MVCSDFEIQMWHDIAGFPFLQVKLAILLLAQIHCSIVMCERLHGSLAIIHKFHPALELRQLLVRAFAHQMRTLFTPTTKSSRVEHLIRQDEKLRGKQPWRERAPIFYANMYLAEVKSRMPPGTRMSKEEKNRVHARGFKIYKEMPDDQKLLTVRHIRKQASQKLIQVYEDLEENSAQLALELSREAAEAKSNQLPCKLSNAAFSETDLMKMDVAIDGWFFDRSVVVAKRDKDTQVVESAEKEWSPKLTKVAYLYPPLLERDGKEIAQWAKSICKARDYFAKSAIFLHTPLTEEFFLFLYATQKPQQVVLLPMISMPLHTVDSDDLDERSSKRLRPGFRHRFKIQLLNAVSDADLAWAHNEDSLSVFVLPEVAMRPGFEAHSAQDFVALKDFLKGLPLASESSAPSRSASSAPAPVDSDVDWDLIAKYPAFAKYIPHPKAKAETKGAVATTASSAHMGTVTPSKRDKKLLDEGHVTDDMLDEAYQALEDKRSTWEQRYFTDGHDFMPSLLGGMWTKFFKKTLVDRVQAKAVGPDSPSWCWLYELPKTRSWSIRKYQEHAASIMALAWCHRMQYFYSLWLEVESDAYEFTEDDVKKYVEPLEFMDLQIALPLETTDLRKRVEDIKSIRPTKMRTLSTSSASSSSTDPAPPLPPPPMAPDEEDDDNDSD